MSRPWAVRPLRAATEIPSGVVDSWLSAFRASTWAGVVPNNLYDAVMADAVRQLIERGATLWLAHNPAHPDQWLGYLCAETTRDGVPVVHWAFVKPLYREVVDALYASLFEAAGIDPTERCFYTFKTGRERKLLPGGRHAPEIARRKAA